MEVGRREFIKGATIAGLSTLAMGAVVACSSEKESQKPEAEKSQYKVSDTKDCDIVVVGVGMSGLAASVQASELSGKVIALEATGAVGGAGAGVEGIFAVDSVAQKEKGIKIDRVELLTHELRKAGYAASGLSWKTLISNSAENYQWLLDNGVEFSGVVDGYMPTGETHTFHWFKDGHARDGYVSQMEKKALENGVEIMMATQAKELIVNNGQVVGLFAQLNDESYVQINAKAVILCAGGFVGNEDLLSEHMNLRAGEVSQASIESAQITSRVGDGVMMAKALGAQKYPLPCIEGSVIPAGFPCGTSAQTHTLMITDKLNFRTVRGPLTQAPFGTVWVEENGLRFANEAVRAENPDEIMYAPRKFVKAHYQIFDQNYVDTKYNSDPDMAEGFEALLRDYPGCFHKADSIEELAKLQGIDPANLKASIDEYNHYCETGIDESFGKPKEFLTALNKAPFYSFEVTIMANATIGGICVTNNFEALTVQKEKIPGLYIAGVDGCMLYNCTYTISTPGSACANSINSGRTSAKHAANYVKSL